MESRRWVSGQGRKLLATDEPLQNRPAACGLLWRDRLTVLLLRLEPRPGLNFKRTLRADCCAVLTQTHTSGSAHSQTKSFGGRLPVVPYPSMISLTDSLRAYSYSRLFQAETHVCQFLRLAGCGLKSSLGSQSEQVRPLDGQALLFRQWLQTGPEQGETGPLRTPSCWCVCISGGFY
jgi:hypothetical protein